MTFDASKAVAPHDRLPRLSVDFASSSERLRGEADERATLVARELPFGIAFLDDVCRGILPHDLVLLGAYTGVGKTAMASLIAFCNVLRGKRVYYFALEAEPREIERRLKYAMMAQRAMVKRIAGWGGMNYPDWYRGKFPQIDQALSDDIERVLAEKFATLFTLYRGTEFTITDVERLFKAVATKADLIVLDHLHYVDTDDEIGENASVKRIVKKIRDTSLATGIPCIVVAHLRKGDRSKPRLVPSLDDFHGSSDISKIATKAILLSASREKPIQGIAGTYISVPKDRMAGATKLVALSGYDIRSSTYESTYTLGRLSFAGDQFEPLETKDYPAWAQSAAHRGGNMRHDESGR